MLLLSIGTESLSRGRLDSTVIWLAYSDAWGVVREHNRFRLAYNDLKRPYDAPVSIFHRSGKVGSGDCISCSLQVSGIIDSVMFGIFLRWEGERHYDFLLTGDRQIGNVSRIRRTFDVEKVISRFGIPLTTPVKTDTLWHDVQFMISENDLDILYDSLHVASIELPLAADEITIWGFSASYCNISLKDPVRIIGHSDTIRLPVNTEGTRIFRIFRDRRKGSSDRILGY